MLHIFSINLIKVKKIDLYASHNDFRAEGVTSNCRLSTYIYISLNFISNIFFVIFVATCGVSSSSYNNCTMMYSRHRMAELENIFIHLYLERLVNRSMVVTLSIKRKYIFYKSNNFKFNQIY